MSRNTEDRASGPRRKGELFFWAACLLLAVNVLLMIKLQSQMKAMNGTLNQVLSRIAVTLGDQDYVIPDGEGGGTSDNGSHSSLQTTSQEKEMDYVELCGLTEVEKPVKRTREQSLERLRELAEDSELIAEVYQNNTLYSDRMLKSLANNPEMADFMVNLPTADTAPTGKGLTDSEKEQDFPLLLQWDPRWGYVEYGVSNIGLSGCGPTCVSMVLCYLLEDETPTPDVIGDYGMKKGYYVKGSGTAWALMEKAPEAYGVKVEQPRTSEKTMKKALDEEKVIVCSVKAGDFTDGGHFVVIYGYDSEGFLVNDPNCVARSREKWSYETLAKQIKHIWVYSS